MTEKCINKNKIIINDDKHDSHLTIIINIGIQLCYYDIN